MEPKKNNLRSSKPNKPTNSYLKVSGVALEVAIMNIILIYGGYRLDVFFNTVLPWITIVAAVISLTGTIYHLMKRLG